MTAALIGTNIGYILFSFVPPILWLLFYLREDKNPEPKKLLMLTFIGGIAAALFAIVVEVLLIGEDAGLLSSQINFRKNVFLFFLIIAVVEEYVKYLPVKFLILKRPDFDEPIDGMIYMMTAALGFAALENALFISPFIKTSYLTGFEVITNRFLGANLLHALSSGIVGFFLARKFTSAHRHHFVAIGIVIASLLHAVFNYLILVREVVPQGTFYVIILLSVMASMVFIDFENLKKSKINIIKEE